MEYNKKHILMVGPDINGLGGISRVVNILKSSGIFDDLKIQYLSSTNETSSKSVLTLLSVLYTFVLALLKKPNLVYVHTSSKNSFYRKLLFIIIALLFKKKIILHIHPTHFYDFLISFNKTFYLVVILLISKMNTIIVLTNEMHQLLSSLIPTANIKVLRNPIDIEKMKNVNHVKRQKNCLLYLGWYIPGKGIYELVDAIGMVAEENKKVHLNLYGTKQIEQLISYVNEKKLNKYISVNGWINDDEKVDELYRSSTLILPSHSEGIPNVILEAMSTKTPIISTVVGGIREVLDDNKNALIIKVNSASDICEKIKWSFENEQEMEEMAQIAYEDALKKYDIKIIKNEFEKIVKMTLDGT